MPICPRRPLVLLCLAFCLLPAARAWGWIETGHKVIALITWEEMTPAARARAVEMLKHHPRYQKDLLAGLPDGADDAAAGRHAFAVASTWPDMVRGQGHPMHFVANHPEWHYIDIPYAIEGQPIPATRPPGKPEALGKPESPAKPEAAGDAGDAGASPTPLTTRAAPAAPHDVVEALAKNVADLRDPAVSAEDKAIALCWLLHLAGDIHQPLHACILYSPQFPKGDQGGNAILVLRDPPYPNSQMNLHLLWDKLPGDYKSGAFDGYLAAGLRADPKLSRDRLKEALAVKDFASWARESHELAVEHAYLKGALKGAPAHAPRTEPREPIPGVPDGYIQQAEQVAARQVVLAADRTADLLDTLFDPG